MASDEPYYDQIRDSINKLPEDSRKDAEKLFCYTAAFYFYPESLLLAEKLLKKYPDNELIKRCHDSLRKVPTYPVYLPCDKERD